MNEHKLILGTVQFGLPYGINNIAGQPNTQEVFSILNKAYEYGIKTIDTAAAYGNSEQLIGEFLKKNPEKQYKIITKISTKDNGFENSLTRSLSSLNVDSIDTVLFHSYSDFKQNIQSQEKDIIRLKGKLFKKIGVSVYDNNEIIELIENDLIDIVQTPFNLLDNESQRGELFRALKDKGKIIHTRSSFLQGLFFMNKERIPIGLRELQPFLDDVKELARQYHINLQTLSLNYVLSKNFINGVLFGVDNLNHLQDNLHNINQKLPAELITSIDRLHVKNNILLNPSKWKI